MKCRICGRECPPAAKICRDCASARKRAFAATVTQPLLAAVGAPSVGEPRFFPKPSRRREGAANDSAASRAAPAPRLEPALPLTVVPHRHGLTWFAVAALIIVGVLIAIARTASNNGHVTDEVVPKPPPALVLEAPALPVIADIAPGQSASEALLPKSPAKSAKKPPPRAEPAAPIAAEPPPAEPQPVVKTPAPPRAAEAVRADPWQALNEGLARCAREGLLDRMSCEQRLRVQYCGNSWGVVPQCPIGPGTDHGQ